MTAAVGTLSPEALETLLQLASKFRLEQFAEASAGELTERGYAVRRTKVLAITDKGILAAREYFQR